MPFDGSGNFTRSYNFVQDKTNGIKIVASRMDGEFDNFATAMNQAFLRNGLVPMTGSLNMGTNTINSIGDGTVGTPAIRFNSDPTTGIFVPGYGKVALTAGGVNRVEANSTGAAVSGTLSVTGAVTLSSTLNLTGNFVSAGLVVGTSPNSGQTGAIIAADAPLNPDASYVQFTNNARASQYGYVRGLAAGGLAFGNSTEFARFDNSGNLAIGATGAGGYRHKVVASSAGAAIGQVQNTAATGFSGLHFADSAGTNQTHIGYGNSSAATHTSRGYVGTIAATPLEITTNDVSRIFISATGSVGIGNTNPGSTLDVTGNVLLSAGTPTITFNTGGSSIGNGGVANTFVVSTSGSERMRVASGGNVGIGNSNPGALLDVGGNVRLSAANPNIEWNNGGPMIYVPAASTLAFASGGGPGAPVEQMRMTATGLGIKTTSIAHPLDVNGVGAFTSPNSGSTGAIRVRDAAGNPDAAYIQFTNNALNVQYGWVRGLAAGGLTFGNGGGETGRFDSSGNWMVGTTAAAGYRENIVASISANPVTAIQNTSTSGFSGIHFRGDSGTVCGHVGWANGLAAAFANTFYIGSTVGSDVNITTNNATRIHIGGTTGNVGIGQTASGSRRLEVNGDIRTSSGGDIILSAAVSGVDAAMYNDNGDLMFNAAGAERMRLHTSGKLMVGGSTQFDASVGATALISGAPGFGSALATYVPGTGAASNTSFYNDTSSARVGWIGTNGFTTTYNTTSDRRRKTNIAPAADPGSIIDAIQIVSHDWINAGMERVPFGAVAQDLYEVFPYAVSRGDNGPQVVEPWGIDPSKLTFLMIREIQLLRERVKALENR